MRAVQPAGAGPFFDPPSTGPGSVGYSKAISRFFQQQPVTIHLTRQKMAYTSRATRFPLTLQLRYRESGTISWHEGSTINISRTGILFRTEQDLPLQTTLEMRVEILPSSKVTLACRGPVVRKQESMSPETYPVLAAMIRAYRLLPNRKAKNPT